jgi:hypothetical protein
VRRRRHVPARRRAVRRRMPLRRQLRTLHRHLAEPVGRPRCRPAPRRLCDARRRRSPRRFRPRLRQRKL